MLDLEQLRKDLFQAKKDRNQIRSDTLSTLISGVKLLEKTKGRKATRAEIVSQLKASVKDVISLKEAAISMGRDATQYDEEINLLSSYIPQQYSDSELENVIRDIIKGLSSPNMKDIMEHLKNDHGGLYDGSIASMIVKRELTLGG